MKKIWILFCIILLTMMLFQCNSCSNSNDRYDTNITVTSDAADGLDLKALTAIIKDVKSGEELEKKLNDANGINNLDLNEDGKVDYLKVSEYGGQNNSYGFSITTEPVKGEEQEVASIEITKKGDQAEVEVRGNEQIYGNGHYYRENHFWRNMFIASYFTRGFGMWHSPYHWGYHPPYYRSYAVVNRTVYRNRSNSFTRGSKISRAKSSTSKMRNPNRGKSASKGIVSKLKSPTNTQKSFQKRNPSKKVRSGGFGRSKSKTSSRSGSIRRSSSSRSRSSRGFGK